MGFATVIPGIEMPPSIWNTEDWELEPQGTQHGLFEKVTFEIIAMGRGRDTMGIRHDKHKGPEA